MAPWSTASYPLAWSGWPSHQTYKSAARDDWEPPCWRILDTMDGGAMYYCLASLQKVHAYILGESVGNCSDQSIAGRGATQHKRAHSRPCMFESLCGTPLVSYGSGEWELWCGWLLLAEIVLLEGDRDQRWMESLLWYKKKSRCFWIWSGVRKSSRSYWSIFYFLK
jgi:hypothetical protein